MGPANAKPIANPHANAFFETFCGVYTTLPESTRKSAAHKSIAKIVSRALPNVPVDHPTFGLIITGKDVGPAFLNDYLLKAPLPSSLTKLSIHKSSLRPCHASSIAKFLQSSPFLTQFDCSENDFSDGASLIIRASLSLPRLESLNLSNCRITESALPPILTLVHSSRRLRTLNLDPISLSPASQAQLQSELAANFYLTTVSVARALHPLLIALATRNGSVHELLEGLANSPFRRDFRARIDSYKSVKGRAMVEQRAIHHGRILGSAVFGRIQAAEHRASLIEVAQSRPRTGRYRAGHAQMEDVAVILEDRPAPGALMFALFDGHGGREAAEFAAENLPAAIGERIARAESAEDAYVCAFAQVQEDMANWCVYVGTAVVVAVIEGTIVTVANVGDSRCVLCRDGRPLRLSVDHKPDLPEEAQRIVAKGGFIRDGRVAGMLAISRTLGDGFLHDVAYPVPSVATVEINERDTAMILACDGVWDVLEEQLVCDIVAAEIDPLEAAKKVRDKAYELEALDNLSVIVVFLNEGPDV